MSLPQGPPRFVFGSQDITLSDPGIIDGEYTPEGHTRICGGVIHRKFDGWRWSGKMVYEALEDADWDAIVSIYNAIMGGISVIMYPHDDNPGMSFEIEIDGSLPEQYTSNVYIARAGTFKLQSRHYINMGYGVLCGLPMVGV